MLARLCRPRTPAQCVCSTRAQPSIKRCATARAASTEPSTSDYSSLYTWLIESKGLPRQAVTVESVGDGRMDAVGCVASQDIKAGEVRFAGTQWPAVMSRACLHTTSIPAGWLQVLVCHLPVLPFKAPVCCTRQASRSCHRFTGHTWKAHIRQRDQASRVVLSHSTRPDSCSPDRPSACPAPHT